MKSLYNITVGIVGRSMTFSFVVFSVCDSCVNGNLNTATCKCTCDEGYTGVTCDTVVTTPAPGESSFHKP